MKNYKIIENRPELTNAQIAQGINFSTIKNNAALAQKAILKSLITKGLITVALTTSSVFIYKTYQSPTAPQKQITNIDTIVKPNNTTKNLPITNSTLPKITPPVQLQQNKTNQNTAVLIKTDSIQALPQISIATPHQVTLPLTASNTKPDSITNNQPTQTKPLQTFKNNKLVQTPTFIKSANAEAKIWNTKNYCDMPNPNAEFKIDMADCDVDSISCSHLSQLKNLVGVWVTVNANKKNPFNLQTDFANVSLIKTDGALVHPTIVGFDGYGFIKKIKTKSFVAHFKNKINIFLFFPDAKPGDKIIIDKFIQTQIQ